MVSYFNNALFSSYHLENVVKNQASDTLESPYRQIKQLYTSIAGFAENLNEAQTEERFIRPILEILGHVFEVQPRLDTSQGIRRPDYVFFPGQIALMRAYQDINTSAFFKTATAIGDAKAWGRNLDKKLTGPGDPFSNSNPNYQIYFYLGETELTWGILTNGKLWRLYHPKTSHKLDSFYEVNLEKILIDEDINAFRYFYYFFRSEAFVPHTSNHTFLDDVLSGSIRYTVSVSDDLGDKIYLALEKLINGFLDYQGNNLTACDSDVEKVHENCLILLYRLLFVLYAEGRGLLPLENPEYQSEYSLEAIATNIHDALDNNSVVSELRNDYWSRLQTLFTLIDKGWQENIPQYNGGLFNPTQHQFLEEKKIGNRPLAKVIDILTRTKERERIAYQDLAIQHLGNIYEGLLEYEPNVQRQTERVKLQKNKNAKKASGSYYTSDAIVRAIVEKALDPICERKMFDDILHLKILDPAMGSGHFLIGVIDYLALKLAMHDDAPSMTTGDTDTEVAYWRRRVVEACIYGVDKNPMAVELAKVSLWLHTVAKGKPLSFLDHHIRCGNSLVGANIAYLANLPVLKRSRRSEKKNQTTLNMDFGFTDTVSEAVGHYLEIDRIESKTADDIHVMEQELQQAQQTLNQHRKVANLWLSVYFGNEVLHSDYHNILNALKSRQVADFSKLPGYQKAQKLAEDYRYFHWEIEFPEVFRDEQGNELENPGFDAIVGNPPYGAKLTSYEKAHLKAVVKDAGNNNNSAAFFIDIAKNRLMKSDGVLAFIVPKSLLFVKSWHSLFFALLKRTRVLIDVETSFKNVRLEQAIFVYDTCYTENFYTAYKFVNETWGSKTDIPHAYAQQFKTWICDVSHEEIQLSLKLKQIGTFMRNISATKRGLPWQKFLTKSGDIPVIGGKNIVRYGTVGDDNFIDSKNLDTSNEKVGSLQKPKVMSQKIIAHIENPKSHIKITAMADQTGDILGVDTVMNTVITDKNFSEIFVSAVLNSDLINWYTHKFIFASAIRTMTFDQYYVGKIPIPIVTPEEQQPIIELAEQIMAAKRENPEVDRSVEERKIDKLVYNLYGLETEERKIVQVSIGSAE
ncbi:hypothetical protein C6496_17505 [Candidatus Poribacteria bacterium]|nr:MAG: hypothetical protein C6496_17505 [Candidatus Poribacteria bacterium]